MGVSSAIWKSVAITISVVAEEAVAALLVELGADGVAVSGKGDLVEVTAYFPDVESRSRLAEDIQTRIAALQEYLDITGFSLAISDIAQADWEQNWKQYYAPARLTRYLTIVPSWSDDYAISSGEKIIKLDPEMTFGTGTHPTTVLALYALEQTLRGGEAVIDVGTGSGVLAIAAVLLGASRVIATDVAEDAVAVARANIALNNVSESVELRVSDLLVDVTEAPDLIVANILAEVLVNLIDDSAQLLQPNGHLILSGIYYDKVSLILERVKQAGLEVKTQMAQGDWHCVIAAKCN